MKNTLKEIKNFMRVSEKVVCRSKNIVINNINIYECGVTGVTFTAYEDGCYYKHTIEYCDDLYNNKNITKNMLNVAKHIDTQYSSCCSLVKVLSFFISISLIKECDITVIMSEILDRCAHPITLEKYYKNIKHLYKK